VIGSWLQEGLARGFTCEALAWWGGDESHLGLCALLDVQGGGVGEAVLSDCGADCGREAEKWVERHRGLVYVVRVAS
jgi:hypothetical protein